ncbi:MAG TPA: T9SS type A sorting domain-containing protein [Bacteroidales bacterium]|nr:T9SS type A sorting domain-containing protein [Bacteroidales bacterium]
MNKFFTFLFYALFLIGQVPATFSQDVPRVSGFDFITKKGSAKSMPAPSEYWPLFESQIPYQDSLVTGDVAIFYGNGNTTLVNPVIIVDGFDPNDLRPIEGLWDLANQQNMIDSLRTFGDDFILLNFHAGADYIQRNAMLVINLLDTVQYIMQQSGTFKENPQIVVVGPSMGGLITRYAITYMESNDMHHHVRNWISFDSPHKGANIPLGIQNWLRFFAEEADSEGAVFGLGKMNSIAAKQMLLYHYTATVDSLAGPNPLRNNLVDDLTALGFPQNTRIVAVANGSGFGITQPFAAGEKVVDYYYSDFLVDLRGDIWAIPDQSVTKIFDGLYNTIAPLDEVIEQVYVKNTQSYDNAPGGDTPTFWEIADTDPGYGDIVALYDSHCFIPTISSLCILNTNDPFFNVDQNADNIITPFDAVYYPYENQEHAEISPESYWWFKNEIHNFAPYYTCVPIILAYTDDYYEMSVSAADTNYWNILEFNMVNLPDWLTFDTEDMILYGIPQLQNLGMNPVSISVSDGLLTVSLDFEIEVLNSSEIVENSVSNIEVYPNPFDNILNVTINSNEGFYCEIFDLGNRLVYKEKMETNSSAFDLSYLPAGIYILKFHTEFDVKVIRIVKG